MCQCNVSEKIVCLECREKWKQNQFGGDQSKFNQWREAMIRSAHEQVARVNAERKAKEANENVS